MAIVRPIGYQQSVEFYSPVYDTPENSNQPSPICALLSIGIRL